MHDAKLQLVNFLKVEDWMIFTPIQFSVTVFCLLLDSAGNRLLFTELNLKKQK